MSYSRKKAHRWGHARRWEYLKDILWGAAVSATHAGYVYQKTRYSQPPLLGHDYPYNPNPQAEEPLALPGPDNDNYYEDDDELEPWIEPDQDVKPINYTSSVLFDAVRPDMDPFFSATITETEEQKDNMDQSGGATLYKTRRVRAGRKKYNPMKLLKSAIVPIRYVLGTKNIASPHAIVDKHLVSEFGQNAGFTNIAYNSVVSETPMHIYDLNYCGRNIGAVTDNATNSPVSAATICDDINGRAWVWKTNAEWAKLTNGTKEPRYILDNFLGGRTTAGATIEDNSTKVYRKSIAIDFMVYGCANMTTMYDIRVIKILKPDHCPDYDLTLGSATTELEAVQNDWTQLVKGFTDNPMMKGIEPGPKITGKWFTTVAKKIVTVPEQTTDVNRVPSVMGKIYVKLNEVNNHVWNLPTGDEGITVQQGNDYYDNPAAPDSKDDDQINFGYNERPHYRARYYLLIRALSPVDNGFVGIAPGNTDGLLAQGTLSNSFGVVTGTTAYTYAPSYDLSIRNTYLKEIS